MPTSFLSRLFRPRAVTAVREPPFHSPVVPLRIGTRVRVVRQISMPFAAEVPALLILATEGEFGVVAKVTSRGVYLVRSQKGCASYLANAQDLEVVESDDVHRT